MWHDSLTHCTITLNYFNFIQRLVEYLSISQDICEALVLLTLLYQIWLHYIKWALLSFDILEYLFFLILIHFDEANLLISSHMRRVGTLAQRGTAEAPWSAQWNELKMEENPSSILPSLDFPRKLWLFRRFSHTSVPLVFRLLLAQFLLSVLQYRHFNAQEHKRAHWTKPLNVVHVTGRRDHCCLPIDTEYIWYMIIYYRRPPYSFAS